MHVNKGSLLRGRASALYLGASIGVILATMPALGQAVVWDGSASSDFSTDANWDTGVTPGAGDTARLNNGALGNQPSVSGAVAVDILEVTAGTLTLNANSDLTAATSILLDGTGTIAGSNGQLATQNFQQKSGQVNSGVILDAGTFAAEAGTFSGMLSGNAVLTKTTAGTFLFSGQMTSGTGSISVNAGTFQKGLGSIADTAWTVAAGATLDIVNGASLGMHSLDGAGSVVNNSGSNSTLVFGAGSGDFSGILADGSHILGVAKNGTGTQILSGANTFSGDVTVAGGGTLQIDHAQALGVTTGSTAVTEMGTLAINNVAVGNETLYLGGKLVGLGNASLAGPITIFSAPTVQVDGGSSLTLSGSISSGGAAPQSLTKTGTGTLLLTGFVAHAGGTTISAGTLQIGNGGTAGTLSGNVANSGTLAFNRSDLSYFGGNVTGTGALTKSGAGTLAVFGNLNHSGGTTITAGTLQIGVGDAAGSLSGNVSNAGTLIFSRSDTTSFGGVISGTGAVIKSGSGALVLSGNSTYIGQTTVSTGLLSVTGSIASSPVTVTGGTLGGSGIVGTTTINGGTLAAGNSIGTLTVQGALNLGAASVLQVEIRPGGNTLGVHSDLVQVNGPATINPTATVQVLAENRTDDGKTYVDGTVYTIVKSTGLTGQFASVTDNFAFLDTALSYDATNAYVTLTRNDTTFASVAGTSNQTGAANALGAFAPGDPVSSALAGLSVPQAQRAFELASGDSHAAGQAVLDQTFSMFQGATGGASGGEGGSVMSYLDAGAGNVGAVGSEQAVTQPLAPNAVWLRPVAGGGVVEADGNGARTTWAAGGIAVGYERRGTVAGGDVVGGVAGVYSIAGTSTPARLATSNAQGAQFGVYGNWSNDAAAFSGSLAYGANHINSRRDIVIGGLTNTATAQYWMQGIDATLQGGYGFELSEGFKVGPLGGLHLGWSGHNGFTETGAGGLNATVGATGTWRVETSIGLQFAYELEGEGGDFELSGRALWLHNFGDNVTRSTVTLAGGGAPFTVTSPVSGRDRLELGAGISWSATDDIKLSVDYTGRFFGGQTDHIARAGLLLAF